VTGENTIAFTKPYWHAFVAHEYVLVDGVPVRWTTDSEAKAAAAIAYRAYIGAAEGGQRERHGRSRKPITVAARWRPQAVASRWPGPAW
jgi:hypothetical protein